MPKNRILLPVDTSDHSMKSVQYVAAVFSASQTEVVLFHIYSQVEDFFSSLDISLDSHNFKMNDLLKTHQQSMEKFMDKARAILIASGYSESDITVKMQPQNMPGLAEDIFNESKYNYHAVVVGRTGISQLNEFMGNTASSLINFVKHIPLIIVDDIPKINKVLIAYDGSDNAERAVQCVGNLLANTSYDVLLYHVIKSLTHSIIGLIEIVPSQSFEKEYYDKQRETIFKKLEQASSELIEKGIGKGQLSKEIEINVKSRAQVILKKSEKEGYGTIVVGRKGDSFAETLGIGTVGRKITGQASNRTVWIVN
ncbi:MAG: universal stress protein [Candidatus Magnetomorum sp.]|nr:universal stress protein [Candidatus Magnetomorum sp.]